MIWWTISVTSNGHLVWWLSMYGEVCRMQINTEEDLCQATEEPEHLPDDGWNNTSDNGVNQHSEHLQLDMGSTVNIYNWTWKWLLSSVFDCYNLRELLWLCTGNSTSYFFFFFNWMFGSEPRTLWNHHIIFKNFIWEITSALVLYFPCFLATCVHVQLKFQSSTGIVDLQFILFLIFSNVKIKNQCLFPLFWHNLHCCIIATKLLWFLENQIKLKVQTN